MLKFKYMSAFKNTQVTNTANYNIANMIFSEPIKGSIPSAPGAPTISYKRIMIGTKNPDGTSGKLLVKMPSNLYCFGVTENVSKESNKVTGHGIACALWDKEKPTAEQKNFTDVFKSMTENIKRHLVENRELIEKYKLEMHHLDEFKPFYWKTEKGQIVEGKGPTFYPKLIESKKTGKILTQFYDEKEEPVDPVELIGKPFYLVDAIVDVESIFIGKDIYMQIKLYEAIIRKRDSGMQSFLRGGVRNVSSELKVEKSKNSYTLKDDDDKDEKEDVKTKDTRDEIVDDDEDDGDKEDKQKPSSPVKKTTKKVAPLKKK